MNFIKHQWTAMPVMPVKWSIPWQSLMRTPSIMRKWACLKGDPNCRNTWIGWNSGLTLTVEFNKDKCKVFHHRNHNPGVKNRLESIQLGSSSVEKDQGTLVDNKLHTNGGCWQRSQQDAGLHQQGHHQQTEIKSLPLSAQHLSGHTYCTCFSFGPCY